MHARAILALTGAARDPGWFPLLSGFEVARGPETLEIWRFSPVQEIHEFIARLAPESSKQIRMLVTQLRLPARTSFLPALNAGSIP